jgi:stearoyl-CoA desaturase (delta-9 desaturase)
MDFSAKMFRDIPGIVSHHYKEGNVNWPMGIYITLVHIVALVGLSRVPEVSKETLSWAFILWPIR